VLAASIAQAQADPAEDLANLIRDNGCRMTEAEAGQMLPARGFDREQVSKIVEAWFASGYARRDGRRRRRGLLARQHVARPQAKPGQQQCRISHRSTSPKTMSSDPSTADTSASMWP
jgi:hypothetical protein